MRPLTPSATARHNRERRIALIPRTLFVAPHLRHAVARRRTAEADLGAMLHLLVVRHCRARFRAGSTELSTGRAGDDMVWRAPQHEVRTCLAQLGTVEQHADEIDFAVPAADRQAID